MIIVKIHGGLGNQLFQYAAGRALAHSLNLNLKIDIDFYKNSKFRTFLLSEFNVSLCYASQKEINSIRMRDYPLFIQKIISVSRRLANNNSIYLNENTRSFNLEELRGYDAIYLKGYWQNEKFFRCIEPVIRSEFTFARKPNYINSQILMDIQSSNSVSLHVRRGDYVSDTTVRKKFPICSMEYYRKAIDEISKKVSNPHFYLFSDDPEWLADNFPIHYPATIITHNKNQEHEDLRLMSSCKHHIIANSSFSWWGAWLSAYHEKNVIAPSIWYKNPVLNRERKNALPQSWQIIS